MKKCFFLLSVSSVILAGCVLEDRAPECGDKGALNGDLESQCQCTSPNEGLNNDSEDVTDSAKKNLTFCHGFLERDGNKISKNQFIYCESYQCKLHECEDETQYASSDRLSCVKCDPETEILDGNECICKTGYKRINGACALSQDCEDTEGRYQNKCYASGDVLQFGNYPQLSDGTKKSIDWIVLEASPKELFLVSKYALEARPYNESSIKTTWEKCTLRSWLNGYGKSQNTDGVDFSAKDTDSFIGTAFTAEEREKIKSVEINNPDSSNVATEEDNSTTDQIFLLSANEAYSYFKEERKRIVLVTPFSKKSYVFADNCISISEEKYCAANWWLRSPGSKPNKAVLVHYDGEIGVSSVEYPNASIRPALRLDLK